MRAPVTGPSEVVIWGASGLLAVVLGVAGAFYLWSGLRWTEHAALVPFLVAGFATGFLLLGMASSNRLLRALVVLFAVSLVLSFLVGSPSFAHLV